MAMSRPREDAATLGRAQVGKAPMVVCKLGVALGGDRRIAACDHDTGYDGLGTVTTGRDRLVGQLEAAADRIADVPRHDLQVLLRYAALRLRNIDHPAVWLDDEYRALIDGMNDYDPGAA